MADELIIGLHVRLPHAQRFSWLAIQNFSLFPNCRHQPVTKRKRAKRLHSAATISCTIGAKIKLV